MNAGQESNNASHVQRKRKAEDAQEYVDIKVNNTTCTEIVDSDMIVFREMQEQTDRVHPNMIEKSAIEYLITDDEGINSSQEDTAYTRVHNRQDLDSTQCHDSMPDVDSLPNISDANSSLFASVLLHERKEIKDNVHGVLYFEPVCMRIIDTMQFQRLRHLHQLGLTSLVYIGATHSRFEHSLGVAHLAETLALSLKYHQPWLVMTEKDVLCVKIAALCHDLGHGPFSHLFEGILLQRYREKGMIRKDDAFLQNWTHEKGSLMMFDHLLRSNGIELASYGLDHETDVIFIKELIYGGPLPESGEKLLGRTRKEQSFLYDIVNNSYSGLDVDKLDYLIRDARQTGTPMSCDIHMIIKFARVLVDRDDPQRKLCICFPEKLAGELMRAFHTRFMLHQTVYQHKSTRAIEYMLSDMLMASHDSFRIRNRRISEIVCDMEAYQHLDDRFLAQLQQSESDELAIARSILHKIHIGQHYKYIGKTTITAHSRNRSLKDLLIEIVSTSKTCSAIPIEEIILETVAIHHGKGSENPLKYIRFFSKRATSASTCYSIPEAIYEMHCPRQFEDVFLRLFVKQEDMVSIIRKAFEQWCRQQNQSIVSPHCWL